jgi:hypothetical protein
VEFTPEQWPGLPNPGTPLVANYTEGLFVGYRWYDAHKVEFTTGFPFGHGIGYTSFAYSKIKVDTASEAGSVSVTATITNTGSYKGAEVAQLYLRYPASANEPPQLLRGFQKIELGATESGEVTFKLTPKEFSVYDEEEAKGLPLKVFYPYFIPVLPLFYPYSTLQVFPGIYTAVVGASSRDARLTATFDYNYK